MMLWMNNLHWYLLMISTCFVTISAECSSFPDVVDNASNNITGSPPFPDGTVARYTCDQGYRMGGDTTQSTCSNSQWTTNGVIFCDQIYCGYVETPANGYLTNSPTYEVGTSMYFACNVGYDMVGVSYLFCRVDGEWNPPSPPTCVIKDCGEFGDILHGETFQNNAYIERNKYGSIVQVECDRGYVLNGPPEVSCEANGQWGARPTCDRSTCVPYPGLNDTRCVKQSVFTEGGSLFINCRDDDVISSVKVGPSAARCLENEWDNTQMACLCNCKIPIFNNSLIVASNLDENSFLSHGEVLDWSCVNGAQKKITRDQSVVCDNGDLKIRQSSQEDVIISNHNLTLNESALCASDAEDAGSADDMNADNEFDTVKAECPSLPDVVDNALSNITEPPPFPDGTVVRYICDRGYKMVGDTTQSTCSNSQWITNGVIVCDQITCGYVETPTNGHRTNLPTFDVGTTIDFACNVGYDIVGVSSLSCKLNGEWNPPSPPTCVIKDCGEFGDILLGETFQNNAYIGRNKYGSIVQVECDRGYVLNGPPEVSCEANGQWGTRPTCDRSTCGPYPGLNDSRCVNESVFTDGRYLSISCRDDDVISSVKVGPSAARCSENVWDDAQMACLCNCKIPRLDHSLVAVGNLDGNSFLPHGEVLDWSCVNGARRKITTDQSIVCDNGDLKIRQSSQDDIVLSYQDQPMDESQLCSFEEDDDKIDGDKIELKKNYGKLSNSGNIRSMNFVFLFLIIALAYCYCASVSR